MKIKTRIFGEIEIEKDKLICFENGIIGFPDLKKFALIHDEEKENAFILWLQSMEEPDLALPVIDPLNVMDSYEPDVSEELFSVLGDLVKENTYILVTITVPQNVEDMAVNLKAPIVINTGNNKAVQVIVENDLPIKYKIYDIIKEKAGE
jgi:flagellar assembly factor FliW